MAITIIVILAIQGRAERFVARSMAEIDAMNGSEFEHYLVILFRARGYKAAHTGRGGDFGADPIVDDGRTRYAVQAKNYTSGNVGNKAVQEAFTAAAYYRLHGLGDSHLALDKFGLSGSLFSGMEEGRLPRAFVVAPSGERGFWIDWYDGSRPYERYFVEEAIPQAERLLGLEGTRQRRHPAQASGDAFRARKRITLWAKISIRATTLGG